MAIGTTRFFQNNTELFSRLNEDLKTLQSQAGSGEADLKLSQNYRDVANLSAAEEAKSETSQFILNSQRVQTDLESLDLAMERFQDLLIRLQEVSVESSTSNFDNYRLALNSENIHILSFHKRTVSIFAFRFPIT